MSYRTILVHCNDERRMERLLVPAMSLAEAFQAHLIALSVVPPVVVTGAPSGPPIVIDEHCEVYRQQSAMMRAKFETIVRGRAFVSEWRDDEADGYGVAERILQYARATDLVVACQTDPEWPGSGSLDVADQVVIDSGRPVLIVPSSGGPETVGEKVLVAWNARREAARAVFDALPLLQRAKEVKVVWVNPQSERDVAQDLPAADICAALARHNVNCQATEQVQPRAGVGETLLACAKEMDADLLVMGCYGHTRLREFVLGGASRHVLAHASLPILTSH